MNKFVTRMALLALVGTMTAGGALAAPGGGPGQMPDCKDPANAKSPMCMHMKKGNGGGMGAGQMKGNGQGGGNSQMNDNGPDFKKGPFPGNGPGNGPGKGPGNGPGNGPGKGPGNGPGMGGPGMGPGPSMGLGHSNRWDRHDRDQFRGFFRSFNFAFGVPDFAIRPGVRVPRSFNLRPLPPQIFRYYPYYRGYLFFETRDGSIVIVDPRSYRIVDII